MYVCLVWTLLLFGAILAQTPEETRVLEVFYNSTGGVTSWLNKWDFSEPLCDQYGIRCLDSNGVDLILELKLTENSLTGTIPGEIAQLTRLRQLDVDKNDLSGTLPSELSHMGFYFQWFRASENRLSGTIFSGISNLAHIDVIELNGNQLSGTIPEDIGPSTVLGLLDLRRNQLSGIIPSGLQQMGRLFWIGITGNNFSCPLTDLSDIAFSDFNRLKQEVNCSHYGTWRVESYSNCTFEGIRLIDEVNCMEDDNRVIDEVNCEYAPKPQQEDCTGVWEASGWGECIHGVQQRTSICKSAEDGGRMSDVVCLAAEPRPIGERVCHETRLTNQIIYIISGVSLFLLLVFALVCYKHRKYKILQQRKSIIPFEDLANITKLAEGNFGVIYKAVWTSPKGKKAVICKIPKLDPSKNDWFELVVLNNVKPHKNVLSLYGICTDFQSEYGEGISIVCPFYVQGSVQQFLIRLKEPLPHGDKCTLALGMTRGLQHVHKSGFIHRDVATRNYLLHDDNEEAILSNFGLSRPISEGNHYRVLGRAQVPAINAPETLSDSISTAKSDIWQLGVSFWCLHSAGTGQDLIPFSEIDNRKLLLFLRTHKREVPLNFRDDSPFSNLIKLCCSFSPGDRPTTDKIITDLTCLREDDTFDIEYDVKDKGDYGWSSTNNSPAIHLSLNSDDQGNYFDVAPGDNAVIASTITEHRISRLDVSDSESSLQSTGNSIASASPESTVGTGRSHESTVHSMKFSRQTLASHEPLPEPTQETESSSSEPLLSAAKQP